MAASPDTTMASNDYLEDDIIFVIGKLSQSHNDILDESGCIIAKTLNKKCTLVICSESDAKDSSKKKDIDNANSLGIKVVQPSFLDKCKSENKRVDESAFITNSKKRSMDDDDEEDEEEDEDEEEEEKKQVDKKDEKKKAKVDPLQVGSKWHGLLIFTNSDDSYDLNMNIDQVTPDSNQIGAYKVEGTIEWIRLDHSLTAFRGVYKDDILNFEEYKILKNNGQVSVPSHYKGKFVTKQTGEITLEGSIVYTDPSEIADSDLQATFSLSCINQPTPPAPTPTPTPLTSTSSTLSSSTTVPNPTPTTPTPTPTPTTDTTTTPTPTTTTTIPTPTTDTTTTTPTTTTTTTIPTPTPTPTPTPVIVQQPLDLPFLVSGANFQGELHESFEFNVKVSHRRNEKDMEGTNEWPAYKTKTKIKGTIENNGDIVIEEYDLISGDGVALPIIYNGKLSVARDEIQGTYKADQSSSGTFNLKLVK